MGYYTREELLGMGFAGVGRDVRISHKASIYDCARIRIGDYSRIDDFCVVSGSVTLGRNVHVAAFCLVAGGTEGIVMEDFSGLAYHVQVFSQSDDYSGATMTNPTVPERFKNVRRQAVALRRHVIVGAGSIVFPGVELAEGCSIGAMSLVRKSTRPWGVYVGNPARRVMERSRDLLHLEHELLRTEADE